MTKDLRDEKQSGEVETKISNLAQSYANSYKPTLHALKKHRNFKRLANNKDIVILRPDKGSGTVILNRDDYIKKLSDIISDTSKFKKLSPDPTLLREGQLQRFLRKPKNQQFFTKEVYDKIYLSGSKPVSIYGLPKIHKLNVQRNNLSLRSIVSSIDTSNYHLSKFLTDLLHPIIPKSHCTKDSITFCEEIKKVSATNRFLISYDVCSFLTIITLKETIDIAVNLLFDHNPGLNIPKAELKKLFEFATSGTYFLFQGPFYDQTDGVAMGSPLGSVLANLFMGYYETLLLNAFRECEIILYRRYVDDIICLFNCESDADKFFEFLNTQHPNIKFTFEKQVNKQISFLDVLITNGGDQFYTSVFRKETAIGLFTNYLGFTAFSYKVGLVRTLLHRAFIRSSSWFLFHEEVVKTKRYLEKNSCLLSFAAKQVKFFLENKINEKCDTVNATNNVVKYYKLPYIGHISTDVKRKINRFCKFYCKI